MTTTERMTYEEMEARFHEAESILGALRNQEVDAVIGDSHIAMVRLKEVEQALQQAKAELEQRVVERTAELAKANRQLQQIVEEQAQTRRELEESQRRLLKAQQIAHLGNWEWDPRSGDLWWSDEAYRLFGIEPGQIELDYDVFLSFVHPQDRERVDSMVRDAVENKRPHTMEFRIIRPDGLERYIFGETEIALDNEGNVARLMGITRDLTERKQALEQLERYTGQLQEQAELLDLAHDMIFVHDMNGRIIFWNQGAERCYGWSREEAHGQLIHRLLRTEYSEPLLRIIARVIRDGWWEGELIHTARDGRKVTVATRWALRKAPDGRPTAILEIDNDITMRKQAEREMAEARRFAESIVDTVQECLIVLDSQMRVISANRSFHETFGTDSEQVAGQFFLALHEGRWDLPELRDRFQEVLAQGRSFERFEVECDGVEQGPRTLVFSARPVREPVREDGMILVVIQDITAYKQQEREIRNDKQQLSLLAEELMQIEERQRRQIAQTLHDSVGQSLAFAKRELRAVEKKVQPAVQERLEQVCGQIAGAIESTRNLTQELSPTTLYTFGLQAAVEELAGQFADSAGFACRVHAGAESVPVVEQVGAMLYRAVRELLVNVAKHAGAANVEITLERHEQNIRIVVEDDGRGFDPSILNSARRAGESFGIYSIRERLTRIGGEFIIESVEGGGTRVILKAPLDLAYEMDQGG